MNKIKQYDRKIVIVVAALLLFVSVAVLVVWTLQNSRKNVYDSYMACGCGGCGGIDPDIVYYSRSRGEEGSYRDAIEMDKNIHNSQDCIISGCSICQNLKLID